MAPEASDIRLVVFDWAGTTVDHGCFAPLAAFMQTFAQHGVTISAAEARVPMGLHKKDHIQVLLQMPAVAQRWRQAHGRDWNDADLESLFQGFIPEQMEVIDRHSRLVPGLLECLAQLRRQDIKIGATTGYFRAAAERVYQAARRQGFVPDQCLCAEDVPAGRPAPWMIFRIMEALDVYPPSAVVKIGDTVPDIEEGLNAGVWSIGVTRTGNEVGLTAEELAQLPEKDRQALLAAARRKLLDAGAHAVIDSVADLPALLPELAHRPKPTASRKPPRALLDENPYLLLTPGPLSTSPTVRHAMLRDYCTWDSDYNNLVTGLRSRLVRLASARDDYTAVLMQGSGTFAVEATLGSVIPPNGQVLIVSNGLYGRLMARIADRLRIAHVVLDLTEDAPLDVARVGEALAAHPAATHLAIIHCETTTGLLNPVAEVGRLAAAHGKRLIVDAMSSFGGIPLSMEELGAHFLISSANKCMQGVPGFAYVVAERRLLEQTKGWARSVSLDLYDQWQMMEQHHGKWRFTSPTHVVRAFVQALDELDAEGGVAARHRRLCANQECLARGMEEIGFRVLLPRSCQSPIITAFRFPDDPAFAFAPFYEALKARGFVIYPGRVSKAETFRIGSIGHVFPRDMAALTRNVGEVVKQLGLNLASGVA